VFLIFATGAVRLGCEILPAMKQKITKTLVDALACKPGQRDFLVFDSELTGFAVRVTETGAKRFLLQYSRAGRTKRLPLGKYGEVTVFEARKLAMMALGDLTSGGDPVASRQDRQAAILAAEAARRHAAEEDAFTVDKLVTDWTGTGLRAAGERHKEESPRAIKKLLAEHLTLPARTLTPAQAQHAVDELALTAPVMATRARNYARAAFAWAVRRKFISISPFAAVEIEAREVSRDRVLTDIEIGEVWRAADGLNHPWGAYFKLLLLTLQRRGEVAGMEWRELSEDFSIWTVPATRAKNGTAHIVQLAEPGRQTLQSLPRFDKSKFVFTTNGKVPISGFTRAKEWLDAAILKERGKAAKDMPALDWTVHDFRRTGVTALAGMGFPVHVADKLLNHVQGAIRGVTAVYQRNEFLAERERALDAWAAYVLRQAAGKVEGGNITPLRRKARPARGE
jgi:integrase